MATNPLSLIAPLALLLAAEVAAGDMLLTRIAFGSCIRQDRPAPIFAAVAAAKPQLVVLMGDNIYADTSDPAEFARKYAQLQNHPDFAAVRNHIPLIGVWDDHDFGKNDAGRNFPAKQIAQTAFLDFFGVPMTSPRRQQQGVYSSATYGPKGKQVRVILLDVRYHRDNPGPAADTLGEAQWQWLEEQLVTSPAQVNLVVSGIQVLPADQRFEKWANFPKAKARLLALLARNDVPEVILLSGDRHHAEISRDPVTTGYPLFEVTSSSLNAPGKPNDEQNRQRIGENFTPVNFGTLTIDWQQSSLTLAIHDLAGTPQRSVTIPMLMSAAQRAEP